MGACEHCNICPCKSFPQVSTMWKPEKKRIMVIGDSLTPTECRKGERMSGPAVKVLNDTLVKAGIDLNDIYYTVAIACGVPKRKGKPMPKEPQQHCRGRLLSEIMQVEPELILVLGKTAMQVLTQDFNLKITQLYQTAQQYSYTGDAFVFPMFHPGQLIRDPKGYKQFVQNISLVKSYYFGEDSTDVANIDYEILTSIEDIQAAMEDIRKSGFVAADIETTHLDYRLADFCVLGMACSPNKAYVLPREMAEFTKAFFDIPDVKWCWHGGTYDFKVMWRQGLGIIPRHEDTMLQHYVLDETSPHDLGYISKTVLHAPEYKHKMNQEFKAVTLETYDHYFQSLCERVAVDACYTYQCCKKMDAVLHQPENNALLKCYKNLLMPGIKMLDRISKSGMLINPQPLHDMGVLYEEELDNIMTEIQDSVAGVWDPEQYKADTGAKSAPDRFNPGSPKQMGWLVYTRYKLKPRIRKGTSTDKKILGSIENPPQFVKLVLKHRKVAKEYSTYVKGMLNAQDIDQRVHTTYTLHVTSTGRLSSKEPNLQNVPSYNGVGNVRQAFIAPPGKILMEVDYSACELRVLACLSKCEVLSNIFIEGRSLHDETARLLYGDNFTKQDRMRAKAANFGIVYGRQPQSFVDEYNMTMAEAVHMVDGWLDAYPGAKAYLQRCARAVDKGSYLETPFGRRRRFGLVSKETRDSQHNEAKNFAIQSTASDLLLFSVLQLIDEFENSYGAKVVNLVHDSVIIEVPKDPYIINTVGRKMAEMMVAMPKVLFGWEVPFVADIDMGLDWGHLDAYDYKTGLISTKEGELKLEDWMKTI